MRGYHVGGRSLLWGRQSYRWSDLDFEANARDGLGVDWPIRYKDIAPWYDYVERFAGISGSRDGLPQLPDGQFLPPMAMNCLEVQVKERIAKAFGGRAMIIGRVANLTQPHNGRGSCQYRNRCIRGCPYGAYFSSNAATLPAAYATGRLTLRPFSIVTEVIYDPKTRKATGVRIVDARDQPDDRVLRARDLPLRLGDRLDVHPAQLEVGAVPQRPRQRQRRARPQPDGPPLQGRAPTACRTISAIASTRASGRTASTFRASGISTRSRQQKDYVRGFGYQGSASRENWARGIKELSAFGADLKADLIAPGPWRFGIGSWGECLPYHENRMFLSDTLRDKWGLPTVTFDCGWKTNELNMRKDMMNAAAEMLEAAGLKNVTPFDDGSAPGLCIHEMGTARMGRDPKTSVLNGWNQVHAAPNVFVTDGACMTSASCVNPSLTYMALTARACDHAVSEIKKRNL